MTDRNLSVARLVEDHIDAIEIVGDAFSDLLADLGVQPKIEDQYVVTSHKPGESETRAYIVSVHTVPGTDGTTTVHACTCPAFKFHELLPHVEEIETDPEAGFESVGRCKHADRVAIEDRTVEDREPGQQDFNAFSSAAEEQEEK